MKFWKFLFAGAIFTSALFLQSCQRNSDEDLDIETQSSTDNYQLESNVNDALKEVDAAANASNLGKAGPTVTIDSAANPKSMIINYGLATICADGKTRSGKLIVTWTGRYRETGTVITITTDSFYQNGNKLEATKTVKNEGRNTSGNLNYTVNVVSAKLTTITGKISTWTSTRNREWTSGENTLAWGDDVYLITGTASGVSSNQLNYTANITSPLKIDLSCAYRLTAGEIEVKPEGKLVRTVNYGSGNCDNTFTVKIANKIYTIND